MVSEMEIQTADLLENLKAFGRLMVIPMATLMAVLKEPEMELQKDSVMLMVLLREQSMVPLKVQSWAKCLAWHLAER